MISDLKKSLPPLPSGRYPLTFSSRSHVLLDSTCRSMGCFELTFTYGVRKGVKLVFFNLLLMLFFLEYQVFPATFVENISFPAYFLWCLYWNSFCHWWVNLFLTFLFCLLGCLSIPMLILHSMLALCHISKLSCIPIIFLQGFLAILVLLNFRMNFRISLSTSTK